MSETENSEHSYPLLLGTHSVSERSVATLAWGEGDGNCQDISDDSLSKH